MESFAAVVRTLLHRIRAIQDSHPWPPSAAAIHDRAPGSIYQVRPTAWGVDTPEASGRERRTPVREPAGVEPRSAARRGLELTVYGLPVPRGLPST